MTEVLKSCLGGEITVTTDSGGYPKSYELKGGPVSDLASNVLSFQSGNPDTVGLNGFTFEDLLTVMQHRIQLVNKDFPSGYNNKADNYMQMALNSLRTRFRLTTAAREANLDKLVITYWLIEEKFKVLYTEVLPPDFTAEGEFLVVFGGHVFCGPTLQQLKDNIRTANYIDVDSDNVYPHRLLIAMGVYSQTHAVNSAISIGTVEERANLLASTGLEKISALGILLLMSKTDQPHKYVSISELRNDVVRTQWTDELVRSITGVSLPNE